MPDPAAAVAIWLLGVVTEDAYSRTVSVLRSRPQVNVIEKTVRGQTGEKLGIRYRAWLRTQETAANLTQRSPEARDSLISGLQKAMLRGLLRKRALSKEAAERIVDATIAAFLPALEPSSAIAVADFRNEQRHSEMIERLDARLSFKDRVEQFPPTVRTALKDEDPPSSAAERLLDALSRKDPRSVVTSFVREPPGWLRHASAPTQLAMAELASLYGLHLEAARLFAHVADLGLDRAHWYARAALAYETADDKKESRAHLGKAKVCDDNDLHVKVFEAAIESDWQTILEALDDQVVHDDPLLVRAYGVALQELNGIDAAIGYLSESLRQLPDAVGIRLDLAKLLLQRGNRSGATTRDEDLSQALTHAESARDQLRAWDRESAEAVELACQVALVGRDFYKAIQLGRPSPDGLALPGEAASPGVQFIVAQAAMALGNHQIADDIAYTATGFRQALIRAELAVARKEALTAICAAFDAAWGLAQSDDDKVEFWLSAGMAGVDPLPGENELLRRKDDLPVFVKASQSLASQRHDDAILLLRSNRSTEAIQKLLAQSYLQADKIDEAIAELNDIAQRYSNYESLVHAVEILAEADRLEEAASAADRALVQLSPSHPRRNLLHEVGVAAACARQAWRDMEQRARAWISEQRAETRSAWFLIQALLNQDRSDTAWQVYREHGPRLEVQSSLEARLWIALKSEYEPTPATLSSILALTERFPEDAELRVAAVNAYFLVSQSGVAITSEERDRWHMLIEKRAVDPAPGDTFHILQAPTDPEDLIETLRPLLEPQAQLVETLRTNVEKGWPYGILAMGTGRTYTQALCQRAAGFLPIASVDPQTVQSEIDVALKSLESHVVSDISVLTTAWYIRDVWPSLVGAFSRVSVTWDAKRDCSRTVKLLIPRSSESLGWDTGAGRPMLHRTNESDLVRLEGHFRWVDQISATLSTHPYEASSDTSRQPDARDPLAFMSSFEAARMGGQALWADDLGLRTLARNEGVDTFGTTSLLEALKIRGLLTDDQVVDLVRTLRNEWCVDFELDLRWLFENAKRESWQFGPALFALSRPIAWVNLSRTYSAWREIVNLATKENEMRAAQWLRVAAVGIAKAVEPTHAAKLVAGLLVSACEAVKSSPDAFASCVRVCADLSSERGLPNAVEVALRFMFDHLSSARDPGEAARFLARLGSKLEGAERQLLREILFDLKR